MAPKSNVPIRICGSKTRSGCKTCKQRHLKCDETHPICTRCSKASRRCVYEQPRSTTPQTPQQTSGPTDEAGVTTTVAVQHSPPTPSPGISLYATHEVVEVSAIKNFSAYLGKELAGCFSDNVWCHIVPRVAQHEPAVWHAIVAVSMLDTSIRFDHSSVSGGSDITPAIKQYSRAIRELSTRLESNNQAQCKDVVLLSCVLFAVFECLQDHYQSALQHINSGLRLLTQWEYEARSNNQLHMAAYLDHTSLQPIFLALDSQAIQLGAIDLQNCYPLPTVSDQLQFPTTFATPEEAHLLLNRLFNRLSHWAKWNDTILSSASIMQPPEGWSLAERQTLLFQLMAWDSAFYTLRSSSYVEPQVLLLMVQRTVIQAIFDKEADGPSEMEWDKYLPLFQQAVNYAEAYTKLTTQDSPSTQARTSSSFQRPRARFTLAMDIVMSLFLVSVKCRDSGVRRRALAMLKTCDRREGIWDSYMCSMVAAKIVNIEESRALPDGRILESDRVHELDIRFGEETGAEVTAKKLVSADDGSHAIESFDETLSW